MTRGSLFGDVPRARPGVWRADLLRAYLERTEAGLAEAAKVFGFEIPKKKRANRSAGTTASESALDTEAVESESVAEPPPEAKEWEPLRHWRVRRYRPGKSTDSSKASKRPEAPEGTVLPESAYRTGLPAPPSSPPLASWARLLRRLDPALRTPRTRRELDVEEIVSRWSQGIGIRELPWLKGLARARVAVVLDPSLRLRAFRPDQRAVLGRLLARSEPGQIRRWPAPSRAGRLASLPAADGEVVFAITDLGFYAGPEERRAWLRWGYALKRLGIPFVALVPCPASRWRGDVARLWSAVDWTAPEHTPGRSREQEAGGGEEEPQVDDLLALLAPAVEIHPGLLRDARRLLGEPADPWLEVAAWLHGDLEPVAGGSLRLRESSVRAWRQRFRVLPAERKARAAPLLLRWHRWQSAEVWATVLANLRAAGVPEEVLGEKAAEKASGIWADAARTLAAENPETSLLGSALDGWFRDLVERGPQELSTDERFGPLLTRAVRAIRARDPDGPLPAGVMPAMLEEEGPEKPERVFGIQVSAGNLLVREDPE
ncbi:MAG: hypothetical protein MI919_29955, partial [Holophagales bacterium]|nr:hypothetical protein [Holophagales bacterium]